MEGSMHSFKGLAVGAMCVLGLSLCVAAKQNKFGVANTRDVNLTAPTLVGDVLLPMGDYKVTHTMQGENHIMVFKQLNTKNPTEARVKCQLVPLGQKAVRDEEVFELNAANQRVLHSMIFKGDTAQHVF
jgi:hypothetical protein